MELNKAIEKPRSNLMKWFLNIPIEPEPEETEDDLDPFGIYYQ